MGVPAKLGTINPNEEDPVGNLRTRIAASFGKSRDAQDCSVDQVCEVLLRCVIHEYERQGAAP